MKLPWLEPGEKIPPPETAWGESDPIPGLLAAGGSLDVISLRDAYAHAVFPWFSGDQPILWWSPDPRMTLAPDSFRLHRSLRKVLQAFRISDRCEIRIDSAFDRVIRYCSAAPRNRQSGTWIVQEMIDAYCELHRAGFAHSVETWIDGELVGGLYCVSIGRAVFGESMFAHQTDASKIALSALVCFCRRHGIELIDCQQNTAHLASLGAREMPRRQFVAHVENAREDSAPHWQFEPVYWSELLSARPLQTT